MGSISLAPADQLWYGSISVGTPAKRFLGAHRFSSRLSRITNRRTPVDFDTGSSDLFLPGPHCEETCSGHAVYDPSGSCSASNIGRRFRLKFADGATANVEGYTDTVSIAGLSVSWLYLLGCIVSVTKVHIG